MNEQKKTINVVAAIIIKDGRLFATQRGYGEWKDWWEFPGGKMEPGEEPEEALKREIREELATESEVGELLTTVEYDYPKFHLAMQCFLCSVVSGELTLQEHEDARWLRKDELGCVKWLPADVEVVRACNELLPFIPGTVTEEIYELISLSFEIPYEFNTEEVISKVCEDDSTLVEEAESTIECDADGIPLGRSKAEIKVREKLIKDFYAKWIVDNPSKKVWNDSLNSYILVKYLSINETYNKAARSYESTRAVFRLSEILKKALCVEELPTKPNNKNQKGFSKMLIMRHDNVKLTVGYQRATDENVQYCISVTQK